MAQTLQRSHFTHASVLGHAIYTLAVAGMRPVRAMFTRLYNAIMFARQEQANRDINRLVKTRGRMTDSLERDISNILLGDGWNQRR